MFNPSESLCYTCETTNTGTILSLMQTAVQVCTTHCTFTSRAKANIYVCMVTTATRHINLWIASTKQTVLHMGLIPYFILFVFINNKCFIIFFITNSSCENNVLDKMESIVQLMDQVCGNTVIYISLFCRCYTLDTSVTYLAKYIILSHLY